MEEVFRSSHLLDYELIYELKVRDVVTTRNVAEKRKMLNLLLAKERDSKKSLVLDRIVSALVFADEQEEIDRSLKSIAEIIADFEGNSQDSTFLRMKSRLVHVSLRTRRLHVEGDQTRIKYVQESYATCVALEGDLYEKAFKDNDINLPSTSGTISQQPIIQLPPPIINYAGNAPNVGDWQVKFNGDGKHLYAFLERISELAHSRKVNEDDLFNSAAELFIGDAFVWFKSVKSSVNSWQSLVNLLRKDFLHSDVEDDLWDQIKNRRQKRSETVAVFIAHMQILFSRLSNPPAEHTKIKHIRKNLLPEYITQLALADLNTVDDLVKLCRKIEEADYLKNKNSHSSSKVNSLEEYSGLQPSNLSVINEDSSNNDYSKIGKAKPNFNDKPSKKNDSSRFFQQNKNTKSMYQNNRQSLQKNKNNSSSRTDGNNYSSNGNRNSNNDSTILCWNCDMPNHSFGNCRLKRKVFCFKCGMKNVKSNSCPNCSKN